MPAMPTKRRKQTAAATPPVPAPAFRANGWTGLRIGVGLMFAVSGFEKLIGPYQNFMFVIEQYQTLQGEPAALLAQTLPWVELIAGVFFMLGLWTTVSGAAILAMFGIFLGAVGQALVRRLPMDECGCFGNLISIPLPAVFAMDLVLASLVALGLRARPGVRALSADDACGR